HCATREALVNIFFTAKLQSDLLDVDDICSVCQAEFQKIILPISQHVFLKNAFIALWFYRGNICPLCRTVISDLRNRWKDGAASSYLQIQ
ncbi:hypothetical protein DBR06_SOUSAS29610004, partial [Sousa chinensis]